MAKISLPLFSLAARGTIGRQITYTGSTGGARAYAYNAPRGTGNPARKTLYADGCAAWQLLTPEQKNTWSATGRRRKISGFNAYIGDYLLTPQGAGIPWDGGTASWDNGTAIWT